MKNIVAISSYVEVPGARELIQTLVDEAALQGITSWANSVLETAQEIVPVRSGELRDSGHIEVTQGGHTPAVMVEFDSDHAVYVEFGTGERGAASAGAGPGPYNPNWPGMAAQPYIQATCGGFACHEKHKAAISARYSERRRLLKEKRDQRNPIQA